MKKLRYTIPLLLAFSMSNYADTDVTPTTITTTTTTTQATKPAEARLWNLQDADILSVINEVSLETGKNFIVDPRVSGKISLVSSKPIKPNEVYNVFLSVLELLGYSAIPSGNAIKIVPNTESIENATKVATRLRPGTGSEVVVRVIPLENVSASQLVPIIRPMLPQWSNIATYMPGNVLILLGRADNIKRIVEVIHNIDKTSQNDIEVIPLRQASAAQMATVLNNLQSASRSTGDTPQISIAADERSNSLLLSGNKYARLHMRFLIQKLDKPTSGVQGNTEVVYLRYLKAKELAPVLGKTVQHMLDKGNGPAGNTSSGAMQTTYASNATSKTGKTEPENETSIQAEPSTNALIVTAPPAMMRAINAIIAKLDVRPAQVLVEAVIVEIDQNDLDNLGIKWGTEASANASTGTNASPNTVTNSFPTYGTNVFGIIPSVQFQAVLSALHNKTGVNILSTPSVVVLDNKKAVLEVGQTVPNETGSYSTTGGSTSQPTPFNTIGTLPVTLKLEVTPQINLGSSVRLTIKLQNDSLQNPDNPTLTPIINTSKIDNSVIIKSRDVLVLGGLISNNLTDSEDKIPLLGDLPIFGNLFKHKTRRMAKKNLMVFIKTTILHNANDSQNITNTKYNVIRQAQINWPEDLTKPGDQKRQNILPLWKNDVKLPAPFADNK